MMTIAVILPLIVSPPRGHKLTAEVCQQAQMLLNKGLEVPQVGLRVEILANTLHKAIRDGRLYYIHSTWKDAAAF